MVSCLYLAGSDEGPVKIGISSNPKKRIESLRVSSANDIRLKRCFVVTGVSAITLEKAVHAAAALHRMNGEWFNLKPSEAEIIVVATSTQIGAAISDLKLTAGKRGRRQSGNETVTLRVDRAVVDHYKALGDDWKARMALALKMAAGL